MKRSRLKALIDLLDDPDRQVFESVERELLKENHSIIPVLEEKWELSYDETCQERIENLIQDLQFKKTKNLLKIWIKTKERALIDGLLIVDRFQYPDINQEIIRQKTEKIKKSVWLELNDSLTLLEKTTILNHFFFNVHGFSVNHKNPRSPQNCYLNQLLDTKKGNPVSLALLYAHLAQQLGLPARLIDFPKNPLIAITDHELASKVHGKGSDTEVLFYINPSNKGSIASRKEIAYHLRKNNYTPEYRYAEPQTDILFLFRLLETLLEAFQTTGFTEKEKRTNELLGLFKLTIDD